MPSLYTASSSRGLRRGQSWVEGQPRPCHPMPCPTKGQKKAPRPQSEGHQAQLPNEPENDGRKVNCPFNFFPGKASRLQKQHFNLNSDSTFIHGAALSKDFIKGFNRFYRTCHIQEGDGANAFSLPPEFQERLRKQIYRENAEQASLVQTRRSDLTPGEQSQATLPVFPTCWGCDHPWNHRMGKTLGYTEDLARNREARGLRWPKSQQHQQDRAGRLLCELVGTVGRAAPASMAPGVGTLN